MGVNADKTIKKMAENMQGLAQIALLNFDEILSFFNACLRNFRNKALSTFTVFLLCLVKVLHEICIET